MLPLKITDLLVERGFTMFIDSCIDETASYSVIISYQVSVASRLTDHHTPSEPINKLESYIYFMYLSSAGSEFSNAY